MTAMSTLRFCALDTLFFRESRPLESIGGSELVSLFPPPPRTLMGALRTSIGTALNADWSAFGADPGNYRLPDGKRLRDLIGDGDGCGPLRLNGPWLVHGDERLYPVPSFLMEHSEGNAKTYVRLRIGPATHTHLGRVRLPQRPPGNAKTLDRVWVTSAGVASILAGGLPASSALYRAADLFIEEPRLGIARDNSRRVASEGLLYQTRHVRPNAGLAIEAAVNLPDGVALSERLIRLGAEGRLAHVELHRGGGILPSAPKSDSDTCGLILILLTSALLGYGKKGWLPDGFDEDDENGVRVWNGRIADVDLTLHSAVIGKAQREGGWNLAVQGPRDVVSLIPAGSAYYVTTKGDLAGAIEKLHGARIGEEQELGRGEIACGLWKRNEF
jgi:CRISPR-associated protein Cmr3